MLGSTRKTEEEKNILTFLSNVFLFQFFSPTHFTFKYNTFFFKLKFIYIEMALQNVFQDISENKREKNHLQKGQLMFGVPNSRFLGFKPLPDSNKCK